MFIYLHSISEKINNVLNLKRVDKIINNTSEIIVNRINGFFFIFLLKREVIIPIIPTEKNNFKKSDYRMNQESSTSVSNSFYEFFAFCLCRTRVYNLFPGYQGLTCCGSDSDTCAPTWAILRDRRHDPDRHPRFKFRQFTWFCGQHLDRTGEFLYPAQPDLLGSHFHPNQLDNNKRRIVFIDKPDFR